MHALRAVEPLTVEEVESGLVQPYRQCCAQDARLHWVAASQQSAHSLSKPIKEERIRNQCTVSPKKRYATPASDARFVSDVERACIASTAVSDEHLEHWPQLATSTPARRAEDSEGYWTPSAPQTVLV